MPASAGHVNLLFLNYPGNGQFSGRNTVRSGGNRYVVRDLPNSERLANCFLNFGLVHLKFNYDRARGLNLYNTLNMLKIEMCRALITVNLISFQPELLIVRGTIVY